MKSLPHFNLFFILLLLPLTTTASHLKLIPTILHKETYHYNQRRILHQPLYPVTPAPPPGTDSPPPPDTSQFPNPDQPFFPQVPTGPTRDQNRQTPLTSSANETIPIPAATQPAEPAKKVAIAISVGIVTLGMLSALAFFLYRHRVKHPAENQKLVGENDQRFPDESRVAPSSLLYIGTVEPSGTSFSEPNGPTTCTTMNGAVSSPYHKLNSVKRSERYRPSPDLQPLSPLPKPPSEHANVYSPAPESSSDDEESQGTIFYTPQGSSISNDDGYYTPAASSCHSSMKSVNVLINGVNTNVRHSKRTSPKSRSPEMKHAIIPSIKQTQTPPPAMPLQARNEDVEATPGSYFAKRTKFSQPPPPPNMALLRSINGPESTKIIPAPPPPPRLPPSLPPMPRKMVSSESGTISTSRSWTPNKELVKPECWNSGSKVNSQNGTSETIERSNSIGGSCSERVEGDENDGSKPKLKPLHWDKVKATSDRATVWDQLKSSSFQLNEDMMESLFGCNSVNSVPKENTRKSVLPPVELENRVLDPKKSQNIAILLRALNVTQDEVPEALLDGNPERLGAELLETLVKMAPTKEEEIKLRDYNGDISKLGSADRFLKAVLDIPFAFRRVEAMLYRANFDTEVKYLRKSFEILEVASEELKNSRLFLKLLEAVLRTGNRMNVGTNRGDAKAFKLDTLLKLVDVKGTDGKTTLLHFVVQEIIRSEGEGSDTENQNGREMTQSKLKDDDFRKQGLKIVSGLSRDLSNVKKAAGMDSDVLNSYVTKLEMGLENVRAVLQFEKPDMPGKFFASMKQFLRQADEEIMRIKDDEKKALSVVKEVTEYFHGNAAKEEAHPLRIFLIVRDFLNILDHVCKEVGNLQDRAVVGSARSFRISATTSLPVLNRYHMKQDKSSDEES